MFDTSEKFFLAATLVSFVLSVSLWFLSSKEQGLFVGLWVPSVMALGIFVQNAKKRRIAAQKRSA
jgi:hypothetical protein